MSKKKSDDEIRAERAEFYAKGPTMEEAIEYAKTAPEDDFTRSLDRLYELDKAHPFEITLDDNDPEPVDQRESDPEP